MLGLTKRRLLLIAVPVIALLGISQTNIPSGGMDILNSAGDAVIQFFDTGDILVTGTLDADVYEQDGVVYDLSAMGAGAKHTIKDEGTSRTARTNINFIGPTVAATDNSGADSTDVTINAVAGPGSSTDNTLPRFDSTTGKIIQSSGIVVDDSNNVSGVGTLDLGTPLAVADGGTGVATLADAGVVVGNGTGNVQVTGAGTSGQVLTSNGTGVDPTFQTFPGGGDALTTNPLDQFAGTTSAEFSGVITDETGTGLVALNNSPAFITPNLGTPSVLTLTNATGLPVVGGGTGASTLTDAGVLIGNGTGVVQATSAGTSGQVLTSNGVGVDPTFQTVSGTGDVAGPASATDNALSRFDGTTGKTIQNSAATLDDSGNLTATSFIGDGSSLTGIGGTGDVDGPASSTDNAITRFDSTTGKIIQNSGVIIDDSNNISGVGTLDLGTALAVADGGSGAGTFTDGGVIIGNGTSALQATSAGTSGQVLTSNGTGVDPTFQTVVAGDPTYGSESAASDDAVFVDENNWLGLGITDPLEEIHIYATASAPRMIYQYYSTAGGDVTQYPGTTISVTGPDNSWSNPINANANDGFYAQSIHISWPQYTEDLQSDAFDFSGISDDASILGVEIDVEALGTVTATTIFDDVYLVRGGTKDTAEDRAAGTALTDSFAVYTFGGPTDDWGGITVAEVKDPDFGTALQFYSTSGRPQVDYITVTIYYSDVSGDYIWSSGNDISDGAYTIRANATDQVRIAYATGDTEFTGEVTAAAFIGDGSGLTGLSSAGIADPGSSTDRAILTWNGTTGDAVRDNTVGIDASGNITLASTDTVDGRDISVDGTKLDGIASGATANTGTVTSAAVSGTDGIEVDSGSPITTSGTFTLGINAATLFGHLLGASTVTVAADDYIAIGDTSNSGALRKILAGDLALAVTGSDNYLFKKIGSTGQFEATGLLVADTTNNVSGLGTLNDHALPSGTAELVSISATQTLTNKRHTKRTGTTTSSATPTINTDNVDLYIITAQAANITSMTTNLTGSPGTGDEFWVWITGTTNWTLAWGASFASGPETLPVAITNKQLWSHFIYDGTIWRCVAAGSNP